MREVTAKGRSGQSLADYLNKLWELAASKKISGVSPIEVSSVNGSTIISLSKPREVIIGKTNATWTRGTLASPTTCEISIWIPGSTYGDALTDSGQDVTAYDSGMIPTSASPIASGTQVRIVEIYGMWWYDGHDCG